MKESWRDEWLKTICALSNTNGGTLYIGVKDDGEAINLKDIKKLLEDLPNKIMIFFSFTTLVEIEQYQGKNIIKITVPKAQNINSFHGKFYIRSGSTTQEVRGAQLQHLILNANNLKWDEIAAEGATFDDIERKTVSFFVEKAIEHRRLPDSIEKKYP